LPSQVASPAEAPKTAPEKKQKVSEKNDQSGKAS
jgi:hypothetical protein